jgi:hypothetical protein
VDTLEGQALERVVNAQTEFVILAGQAASKIGETVSPLMFWALFDLASNPVVARRRLLATPRWKCSPNRIQGRALRDRAVPPRASRACRSHLSGDSR